MTDIANHWPTAILALAAIIGLLLLLARLARVSGIAPAAGARRIALLEALPIDARRRAVLLRCDGREVLLVIGGEADVVIGWLPDAAKNTHSESAP